MVSVLIGGIVLEYVHLEVFEVPRQGELHLVGADHLLIEVA